jgi:Tfp pilus assembly protein PilF
VLGGSALKSATWEAAEENLAYAEAQAPHVPDHHLQLALLYRDTDRPELAAEEIRHVMALQAYTALDVAVQAEASRLWAELQD